MSTLRAFGWGANFPGTSAQEVYHEVPLIFEKLNMLTSVMPLPLTHTAELHELTCSLHMRWRSDLPLPSAHLPLKPRPRRGRITIA